MAIDTGVPRTRRALLAGGAGGLVALVAAALGRPLPASAAEGEVIHVGDELTGTSTTLVRIDANAEPALMGKGALGDGVVGETAGTWKSGVYGVTTAIGGYGVSGRNTASLATGWIGGQHEGVRGDSANGYGVLGQSVSGYGVFGWATGKTGWALGVAGTSESSQGAGMYGYATAATGDTAGVVGGCDSKSGIGVYGHAAAASGATRGVYGRVCSPDGTGVIGYSGPVGNDPAPVAKTAVYGYAALGTGAVGIRGACPAGHGVYGTSGSGIGVRGGSTSSFGVHGTSGSSDGVNGFSDTGNGVYGRSPVGAGVRGITTQGVGLYGSATTGYALRTVGRVRLDKCVGVATISAGNTNVKVTPGIDLVGTSAVVASLMGSAGGTTTVHRSVVNATANTFTIYLTKAATQDVKVAWHVFG